MITPDMQHGERISVHSILLWVFLVVAGVFSFFPATALAAESVRSFTTSIELHTDGSFSVEEEILYDFGDAQRHGIYRTIPQQHPQPASSWYVSRVIDITDVSVMMDGRSVPAEVTQSAGEKKIRIGDPDRTLTGEHTYTLSYVVAGGLFYYDSENPEFYWNVTGNDWDVPIEKVTATVQAPAGLLLDERTCYAGAPGTGSADSGTCEIEISANSAIFTAGPLFPGEEVTVAQSLDESLVSTQIEERIKVILFALIVIGLFVILFGYWIYRWVTNLRLKNPTIIAQYESYMGALPMYTGVLLDGRLDPADITAGIIHLATEGFLKIRKINKKVLVFNTDDYEVQLTRSKDEAPTRFHKELLDLLFAASDPGIKISLLELKKDKAKQRTNQKTVEKLRKAIKEDLLDNGFFEKNKHLRKYIMNIFLIIFGVSTVLYSMEWFSNGFVPEKMFAWVWGTFIVFALSTVFLFAFTTRRRTRKGYEARAHTLGFKTFLSVTDKERFRFHNAPEKSPQVFMSNLPFAIALGVEKEWAEVFKDISIPQPEWYQESGVTTFAASDFVSHVNTFGTAMATSIAAAPSGSGAGGGGYAGGGAGGGGGGSW